MFYHLETEERTAGGKTGTVYTLRHNGGAEAEVWPAHGFNCLRWRVPVAGAKHDLLYAAADWDTNPVPTRSGVPILFPFPNRIRDGRFRFGGKEYELPRNDPAKKNAIHGWAPRFPWRVTGYGAESDGGWVHGDFRPSIDAPEVRHLWPSDFLLSVVYRFTERALRVETSVRNVGDGSLPFGLGFHPYFRFPCADATVERYRLLAPARSVWELVENLPTGAKEGVTDDLNWNAPRPVNSTALDTLYTDLGAVAERGDGMILRAAIGHVHHPGAVQIWTDPCFGESVLFTPPHRQALCVEPYTCATDAVNLAARGIDAGWRVLEPGGKWSAAVEFRWEPAADV
jgi:aldose 1-epimerase